MAYMTCVACMTFFIIFILFYFISLYYKFSNSYFLPFFCMRKPAASILEGGSLEFLKNESGCVMENPWKIPNHTWKAAHTWKKRDAVAPRWKEEITARIKKRFSKSRYEWWVRFDSPWVWEWQELEKKKKDNTLPSLKEWVNIWSEHVRIEGGFNYSEWHRF